MKQPDFAQVSSPGQLVQLHVYKLGTEENERFMSGAERVATARRVHGGKKAFSRRGA
ncbi:MAG TPA: hypothetical protein VFE93_09445 [Myxococcaceae bacterium]|nr:hypothetical protein [Myxococcaceae bacterium]